LAVTAADERAHREKAAIMFGRGGKPLEELQWLRFSINVVYANSVDLGDAHQIVERGSREMADRPPPWFLNAADWE
jgi:hypothetical protein